MPAEDSDITNPGRYVLVKWYDQYVTWLAYFEERWVCIWGHYFDTLSAAECDLIERSKTA